MCGVTVQFHLERTWALDSSQTRRWRASGQHPRLPPLSDHVKSSPKDEDLCSVHLNSSAWCWLVLAFENEWIVASLFEAKVQIWVCAHANSHPIQCLYAWECEDRNCCLPTQDGSLSNSVASVCQEAVAPARLHSAVRRLKKAHFSWYILPIQWLFQTDSVMGLWFCSASGTREVMEQLRCDCDEL